MEHQKIIDKLIKINELVKRGDLNEAQNAKNLLDIQLQKYNLNIEDIDIYARQKKIFKCERNTRSLLFMCLLTIVPLEQMQKVYYIKNKPLHLCVEVTNLEYIEVVNLYQFHKKNFLKEKQKNEGVFEQAYQFKHKLYTRDREKARESDLSKEEIENILHIAQNLQTMNFYKQLSH